MHLTQNFELSITLDKEQFQRCFGSACRKGNIIEEREKLFVDYSLFQKGILVLYRNSQYKKKIRVVVNTRLLIGDETLDAQRLVQKLRKRFSKYFDGEYNLEHFDLARTTITAMLDTGDRATAASYLKVLKRIGKVKGFSPVEYEGFEGVPSFCLRGNSNGIDFLLYARRELLKKFRQTNDSDSSGILVAEVRLNKPKAIHAYTDEVETSEQLAALYRQQANIFLDTMTRIVPDGAFYKKPEAIDIISREESDPRLKRRMIRLVALLPEKKSLKLAQKEMQCRHMDEVMEAFREINLSPATISKRHDRKYLKSLYTYL